MLLDGATKAGVETGAEETGSGSATQLERE